MRRTSCLRCGLSPRVRGNQMLPPWLCDPPGSIPACAGEPNAGATLDYGCQVYPRVCGGTIRAFSDAPINMGLSPRVRGNPALELDLPDLDGSIPACAGEPQASLATMQASQVYPRVCGGTGRGAYPCPAEEGLSPRVRGNRQGKEDSPFDDGSIPACAGEPFELHLEANGGAVYPRVCGGTAAGRGVGLSLPGLSPRVRGNRFRQHPLDNAGRSIPACAGEPARRRRRLPPQQVYPRVCGGTKNSRRSSAAARGLSPRVRGNRVSATANIPRTGSIPACAGEPFLTATRAGTGSVYPRVCGGTLGHTLRQVATLGLSPRVRGNPALGRLFAAGGGSIPACAGEPAGAAGWRLRQGVYPRVCGGTFLFQRIARRHSGLSPRVRGNRPGRGCEHLRRRSIPACAGEPWPVPSGI